MCGADGGRTPPHVNYRPDRVSSIIQRELSKILQRNLDVANALVTVTGVEVDSAMERAKAKIGVIPAVKDEEIMRTLAARRGALQFLLARKLNIKPMPRIEFVLDAGAENAAQVEKLLMEGDNKGVL